MKHCPFCAEEIQDSAVKCKHCGEMLNSTPAGSAAARTAALLHRHKADAVALVVKRTVTPMGVFGALLLCLGLVVGLYFLAVFDPSVAVEKTELFGRTFGGGRVNNMGLMQDKQNGLMLSGLAAVVGLGLVILSEHNKKKQSEA